jgi:hypothetical protein
MSLFGKLFGKKEVPRICDPVFGQLTYERGTWSYVPKRPEAGFVVTVCAPESGPSSSQRVFFQHLGPALSALEDKARDFIRLHTKDEVDVSRLSIYALEVGTDAEIQADRFVMELSDADEIVIHRVSFESGKPTHYTYDD